MRRSNRAEREDAVVGEERPLHSADYDEEMPDPMSQLAAAPIRAKQAEAQLLGTEYLHRGSPRQGRAAAALEALGVGELPGVREWALAGTVPLEVDLPESDLDVLVCTSEVTAARDVLIAQFGELPQFAAWPHSAEVGAWCVTFDFQDFLIEFFLQDRALTEQRAFRHLVAEYVLLQRHGPAFRQQIFELKQSGFKTEPAFAQALNLRGDPYLALLDPALLD